MDGQRFDDLTRALARGASRRQVLKGLVGGVSGGLAALLGRTATEAGRVSCGNIVCAGQPGLCASGCDCCVFVNGNSRCMTASQCHRLGGVVSNGCAEGLAPCAGTCVDEQHDLTNCGACGNGCPASTNPCQVAVCTGGECGLAPADEGASCDDGNACTTGDTCQSGVCTGIPINCDDGVSCTTDNCDPSSGCIHSLQPGFCLIAGTCYADQTVNLTTPCQRCDVATATDAWTSLADGAACGPSTCTDGTQTDFTCDGAGRCVSNTTPCGLYHCGGDGVCHTSCSNSTECLGEAYCDPVTHTCKGDQENGAACVSADQCASGYCVDGVCCDSACTDQCAACNITGREGACSPVTGQPVGDRPACTNTGTDPVCAASCDGTTTISCIYPGAETTCGEGPRCAGSGLPVAIGQDVCSGDGNCDVGPQYSCFPYACVDNACAASCTDVEQCVPTASCDGNVCVPQNLPNGSACTSDYQCASELCPFGVCCIISSDPTDCEDCFHQCTGDQICLDHQCITPAADGAACTADAGCQSGRCCGGSCGAAIDNCAGCGQACPPPSGACETVACVDSTCVATPRPSGTVCRAATSECEADAVCDGASADCPANVVHTGQACGADNRCLQSGTGICQSDGTCLGTPVVTCEDDNGLFCTVSVCDPATGSCVQQVVDGFCLITLDSTGQPTCFAAGSPFQDGGRFEACAVCDPARSQTGWSVLANGTSCSELDLCLANAVCQGGRCIGDAIVECPQPAELCQEGVCDPTTGSCIVQGIFGPREDRKGCDICSRCIFGVCTAGLGTVGCPTCQVCDPAAGACVQAPAGTDCGSTCDIRLTCDENGSCQTSGGGCPVAIGECQDIACDPTTLQCVETGAKDGQSCGLDACHVCAVGQCVARTCGACESCHADAGCEPCELCCGGVCGQTLCGGTCCPTTSTCTPSRFFGDFCCSNTNACEEICYPHPVNCCDGQRVGHCDADEGCCFDRCCAHGEVCCGPSIEGAGRCCPAGSTCCPGNVLLACCGPNEVCSSFGCIPG